MKIELEIDDLVNSLNTIAAELNSLNINLARNSTQDLSYKESKENISEKDSQKHSQKQNGQTSKNSNPKTDKNEDRHNESVNNDKLSLSYIEGKVTKEELTKRLTELSRNGKGFEVSKLINKYGAIHLSDVNPKYYKNILEEVEEL